MPQSPSFSQRYGYKQKDIFQIDSIDNELKSSIWNTLIDLLITAHGRLFQEIDKKFFKNYIKVNELERYDITYSWLRHNRKFIQELQDRYVDLKWYEVYDLIEFIINSDYYCDFDEKNNNEQIYLSEFVSSCNEVLEKEMSAYRIINNRIVRITDETEIASIEEAIKLTAKNNQFNGAKTHLETAIKLFSERENRDYRNTIKESISAVENVCRVLTGKNELGGALGCLEKKNIKIHSQLKKSFENLYHYTNDKSTGIRHAIIESEYDPTFEEAKYMLVSCTAFVNYLIGTSK